MNPKDLPSIKDQVSDEEWELRLDLAACYRTIAHYGWDDLIFTHISSRTPGEEREFLINPFGLLFSEITASSLVKVDQTGQAVMETPFPVNPAGFTIHGAIHEARDDAHCVLHLHTPEGVAVSAREEGLTMISQSALSLAGEIAYHDYEGIVLDGEEKERLIPNFGDKHYLILRNHGLLTVGKTIAEAFIRMYFLQRACEVQVMAGRGKGIIERDDIGEKVGQQAETGFPGIAPLAWGAVRRLCDNLYPDYAS